MKPIFIFAIYISLFINVEATIITKGYHFFDMFYYRDIYKDLIRQKTENKCTIDDGPNCIFINGKNKTDISKELSNIYPENDIFLKETPENILMQLKQSCKLINEKETESIEDKVYSFDSPFVMSLYLTFESYDEITKNGDVYAPESIDTPYDVGRLTLTIMGKLRLSQKNAKQFENPTPKSPKDEGPKGTYAYVESKEVIIKFNSKSSISFVYIKKNIHNKDNKTFFLYGYKNGHKHIISKIQNVPSNYWIKVTGDGKKYDSIGLIRGFDYDNIIINASFNKENSSQLKKKYSSVINEKINDVIQDTLKQIKNGQIETNTKIGNVKVLKIDLNQNDIIQEQEEEEFEIPEELMDQINNEENNGNKNIDNKNNKEIPNQDL